MENKNDIKTTTHKKQLSNDTYMLVAKFIGYFIISCFFAYCGYIYCIDNDYEIINGVVFGFLFPIGAVLINNFIINVFDINLFGIIIVYFIYLSMCILVLEYIPVFIGIICIVFAIIYSISYIYSQAKIDESITISSNHKVKTNPKTLTKTTSPTNINKKLLKEGYEYYCARCDKPISEQEYIDNWELCDDCIAEVYFGQRYKYDDHDMWK